jgi:N-acetylglucosaminyldiphosphoundecaprenol N-acetyl-beta-D-mannosaminyltransferase
MDEPRKSPASIIWPDSETPTSEMPVLVPGQRTRSAPEARQRRVDITRSARISVGDIPFTATIFEDVIDFLLTPTNRAGARSVRLANAYCVAMASHDPDYAEIMNSPIGLNLPDGTPVHWMMQRATKDLPLTAERVRGPSLFTETLKARQPRPARHFFLGGSAETLNLLQERLRQDFPQVNVAGMHSPPFGPVSPQIVEEWAELISASGATIVWVGLGSPKQDYATSLLAAATGLHCVGVGAAFDFLAGTQREAPRWMQRAALEWAYRLATEPRRLWRRYFLGNARFIAIAARTWRRDAAVLPSATEA